MKPSEECKAVGLTLKEFAEVTGRTSQYWIDQYRTNYPMFRAALLGAATDKNFEALNRKGT